ncbi:hypothetical protein VPH35_066978 [Triticum aestivum]
MDSCSPSQSVALATERAKIHGAARGVSISSSCSSILLGYRLGWVAEMANSSSGVSGWCGLIFQEIKSCGYMLSINYLNYTCHGMTNNTCSSLKAVNKIQPVEKLEGF